MLKYSEINQEKTFAIIDTILTLESCLYHQIIPISLEENILTVGMIKPHDELILDYLKSILPSHQQTLQVEQISPETHNLIISSYQKYTSSLQKSSQINKTQKKQLNRSDEENNSLLNSKETFIINSQIIEKIKHNNPNIASLKVNSSYQDQPLESLTDLTSEQLWQELLVRLIKDGIGRLFLERKKEFGRLIITNNGVVTSSLETVDLEVFNDIFKAVKILANIGENPLEKNRRIELKRIYQKQNLLLRFQLFPGKFGEEGNIQILRDKALSFYQEKQMNSLGEQVLRLTKQLDRKLHQIQDLQRINPTELEVLPQIRVIQAKILEKLESLDN